MRATARRYVELRRLPTNDGNAELLQARLMAVAANRDETARLLGAAAEHGNRIDVMIPLEFLPYRDYPPFRAIMFPPE